MTRHICSRYGIKWIEARPHFSTERCDTLLYNVLVTFRTQTNQQKAQRLWRSMGIQSRAVRPPLSLTKGSCGYGLELSHRDAARGMEAIKSHGIEYGKLFDYD